MSLPFIVTNTDFIDRKWVRLIGRETTLSQTTGQVASRSDLVEESFASRSASAAVLYFFVQHRAMIIPPYRPFVLGNSCLLKRSLTRVPYSSISSGDLNRPPGSRWGQCPVTIVYKTDPRIKRSVNGVGVSQTSGSLKPASGSPSPSRPSSSQTDPPKSQSKRSKVLGLVSLTRKLSGRRSLWMTPLLCM